jgi:hypothetical protein
MSRENLVLLNNTDPTYFRFNHNYSEILDLAIGNIGLAGKVEKFSVMSDDLMGSDHSPISVVLKIGTGRCGSVLPEVISPALNFQKANWAAFAAHLENISENVPDGIRDDVEALNSFVTASIIEAASMSIPQLSRSRAKRLPRDILDLMKQRKVVRRKMAKDQSLKLGLVIRALRYNVKNP